MTLSALDGLQSSDDFPKPFDSSFEQNSENIVKVWTHLTSGSLSIFNRKTMDLICGRDVFFGIFQNVSR